MNNVLRILGIDPGTATVGWAVLEVQGTKFHSVGYGHISTSANTPMTDRLLEIAHDIEELIAAYAPHEAAVESLFFFKNQKTVISVGQARGALLLTLARSGLTIAEYTPLQVKQALTGYGRAEKKQMQEMVKVVLRLKTIPRPDDAADAAAIALCHAQSRASRLLQNIALARQ